VGFWRYLSLGTVLLGACAQPPDKEVALAGERVEKARQAGAAHYAADLLRQAEEALAEARRSLGRPASYRAAIRAAALAALRADEARALAREGRRKPTAEAERLLREAAVLIEQARSLDGAERFRSEVEDFERRLATCHSDFQQGRPEKTRHDALQLKSELLALHRRLRELR
jgi:hypothetical protein